MNTAEHCTQLQMLRLTHKTSKKQESLYWFLDSSFGFQTTKKLQYRFPSVWHDAEVVACFLLIFHFYMKKSFLGALSGSTNLFRSLFNTRHVFIPKFSVSLHGLLCKLHTSTTAADSFSPKLVSWHIPRLALGFNWLIHLSLVLKSSI